MPELLLELLTEEIPARLQARAAQDLCSLVSGALGKLVQVAPVGFVGPRRLGLTMNVVALLELPAKEERGPRLSAPEAAVQGFLKKHGVDREALSSQGDFWVLKKPGTRILAHELVSAVLPDLIWRFPWPKSMRWGVSSFTWVRPLQRIVCLMDGVVVPFSLRRGDDACHGLESGDVTEGHRVHAPHPFKVSGCRQYASALHASYVVLAAEDRVSIIRQGIEGLTAAEGLEVVPDEGLLSELAGLVEWPVPLLGRIEQEFMGLPAEVLRTSMRVNQRYFTCRNPGGALAPRFGLVANIDAPDQGAALIAGNERVLRARLSDARFFWEQDLAVPLDALVPRLDGVVFHARLGSQGERVKRIEALAMALAPALGAEPAQAQTAARLCKADLLTGMVNEFPELQGIMGGHYAREQGQASSVANAIAQHYRPQGPADDVPSGSVATCLALADKLDQLVAFFAINERPTGSGDPFALRRAALGVIRILRATGARVQLRPLLDRHSRMLATQIAVLSDPVTANVGTPCLVEDLIVFILDRLRIQLRGEERRGDLFAAAVGEDDDLIRILARADALRILESASGKALLATYKRIQNIVRIEDNKDGSSRRPAQGRLDHPFEVALVEALEKAECGIAAHLGAEQYRDALEAMFYLQAPLEAFFSNLLINEAGRREDRLLLLGRLKYLIDLVADFSKIDAEGQRA